ncbi:hypothetical protein ATPR_1143 [Acetobacter tropicalis NBRC 101654]|uniref:Uncharacterized protein n=1 Tax=Acetobacter tropicalis NBRC 101654 TaxID=749388 RepID=F7VCP4_9PROT|nr:hypothetical protein ATPR_1143 [Acetobacter tropicalis NBRC 101654]
MGFSGRLCAGHVLAHNAWQEGPSSVMHASLGLHAHFHVSQLQGSK